MPKKKTPGPEAPGRGIPHKADEYKKEMVRRLANIGKTKKECMEAVGLKNKNSFDNHYGEIYYIGKNKLNDMTYDVMLKFYENCIKHNKVHAQAIWMKTAGKWFEAKDPGEQAQEGYKPISQVQYIAIPAGEKASEADSYAAQMDDIEDDEYTH